MVDYFVDIEFKTTGGDIYYFPLFIEAANYSDASKLFDNVKEAIKEQHTILRAGAILQRRYFNRSILFKNYQAICYNYKCSFVNFREWTFKAATPDPTLTFNENISLIDVNNVSSFNKIIAEANNFKLPIYKIRTGLYDYDDFLLLNVLKV